MSTIHGQDSEQYRNAHIHHLLKAALCLAGFTILLFLINRQWLRENVLINSPSFDALVYQNQSYDDYWLLRSDGPLALLKKYTDGRWHVPPLYMWCGTFVYLIFGLDPANFYITPTICLYFMLLGCYGFVHFTTRQATWATVSALLLLTMPSVVSFGLRVSQIDFSVGALFTFSTYLLVLSEGGRNTKSSMLYALFASICMLLKSSIVLYFLAHAAIILYFWYFDSADNLKRFTNVASIMAIGIVLTGWFFFTNYGQIFSYYREWGTKLNDVSKEYYGISNWRDVVFFYLKSFSIFHLHYASTVSLLKQPVGWYFFAIIGTSLPALLNLYWKMTPWTKDHIAGLSIVLFWFLIPYTILTLYSSKAYTVDFPFVAVFYILPILFISFSLPIHWQKLTGLILLGPLLTIQSWVCINTFLIQKNYQNWKEEQILGDILYDAEQRELTNVTVTNAFIHSQLTSENLRFFVVNGTFRDWLSHYSIIPISYYDKAEDYYHDILQADYILAKSGEYLPPAHPDNLLAPEVNQLLARDESLDIMKSYSLPDGSDLRVYRNKDKIVLSHPTPYEDGWIGSRFPLKITPVPEVLKLHLHGDILLPKNEMFPVQLFLEDETGQKTIPLMTIANGEPFDCILEVSLKEFIDEGQSSIHLYLNSDRAFTPSDYGISQDKRRLMMRLKALNLVQTLD